MLPLSKRAALDRMIGMNDQRWQIDLDLGSGKRVYVVHARTAHGALGEALHRLSLDTNRNLHDVRGFEGRLIAQVEHGDEPEGVPV